VRRLGPNARICGDSFKLHVALRWPLEIVVAMILGVAVIASA